LAHFRYAFKEVQESAPDFGNVHEVFEILRGVEYVAAHGERLQKSRELLDRGADEGCQQRSLRKHDVAPLNNALGAATIKTFGRSPVMLLFD
jgi:hypothetical protein